MMFYEFVYLPECMNLAMFTFYFLLTFLFIQNISSQAFVLVLLVYFMKVVDLNVQLLYLAEAELNVTIEFIVFPLESLFL